MQKVMSAAPSTSNDAEMEELRNVKELALQEVSRLQAEFNEIKLQDFEGREQIVNLTSELDEERRARKRAEQELEVKSERDILARQSQLLMMDAASDEKIMKLLFEVEQLQRTLSQERQEHIDQLKYLHLECQSKSEQIELYGEKLKLIEAELLSSQQRADIAESQVEAFQKQLRETKTVVAPLHCSPSPPPPPPLPPPAPPAPPPPPISLAVTSGGLKLKTVSSSIHNSNAIEDLGNYLRLQMTTPKGPQVQNGSIDAIIDQIKGGRFCLKATDKEKQTPVKNQESQPVVNEMMNVLCTLRRNPKRRNSFKPLPADVEL